MPEKSYVWDSYTNSSPEVKSQVLDRLTSSLDDMNPREQVDSFRGAPADVILRYFGDLEADVQVKIWKDILPVGARVKAKSMLKYEARKRLKMVRKFRCLS